MKRLFRLLVAVAAMATLLRWSSPPSLAQDLGSPTKVEQPADESAQNADGPEVPKVIQVTETVADDRIAERLQRILNASGWFEEPQVAVKNGLVTLTGHAQDVAHRDKAGEWAQSTEGVVAVFNKITVEENVTLERTADRVLQSVRDLWNGFITRSPLIFAGLIVLTITAAVARFCRWLFQRTPGARKLRVSLQDLIEEMINVAVWIVGILIAATVVFPGITPARLLTVLGLSGIAIGFAFKDIFENFLAGMLILWRFPFDRGDYIECQGIAGKVQQITVRNTLIRQVDGQLVVAPNALLFQNPVHVLTNWKSRRITVIAGVAYGENVDKSREVIKAAVEACETVEHRKPVEIFAREFGESSINFEVTWWAGPTPLEERRSRDEVVAAVKRALDNAGIEIPFPYRTLTFKEPLRTLSESPSRVGADQQDGASTGSDSERQPDP